MYAIYEGDVYAWGANLYGQAGVPITAVTAAFDKPIKVQFSMLEDEYVYNVFAIGTKTYILTSEGRLFACGNAFYGISGAYGLVTSYTDVPKRIIFE
jgi:alpha-tubulin suppressor-like RCC1 family protein